MKLIDAEAVEKLVKECCFVGIGHADEILAAIAALPDAQAWQFGTPVVRAGDYAYFVVTVERKGGKRYSFPAAYLNALELDSGDELDDEGDRLATGWHDIKQHPDYDNYFHRLLSEGDAVIAWRPIPPPLPAPPSERCAGESQ